MASIQLVLVLLHNLAIVSVIGFDFNALERLLRLRYIHFENVRVLFVFLACVLGKRL